MVQQVLLGSSKLGLIRLLSHVTQVMQRFCEGFVSSTKGFASPVECCYRETLSRSIQHVFCNENIFQRTLTIVTRHTLWLREHPANNQHRLFSQIFHDRPPAPGTFLLSRLGPRSGTAVTGCATFTGIESKLSAWSRSCKQKRQSAPSQTQHENGLRTLVSWSTSRPPTIALVSSADTSGT